MAKNQQIPVYLFIGFLESGKTRVIQETMEDERFNTGEKTLIVLCEEGIEELDKSRFYGQNVVIETVENEEDLAAYFDNGWHTKHRIDRVILEYNGMWQLNNLFAQMPEDWFIFQSMMFCDATTFLSYNQNMRSLMVDKLMNAEMVVFNRANDNIDKDYFHKIVRGSSRRAQIVYEYPNGEMEYDEIEDPLPFDKNAPVIKIEDDDYALFYRDLSEDLESYDGKVVKFKGIAGRDARLSKGTFIIGRHIMTCCADDISYNGLLCVFPVEKGKDVEVRNRDWLIVEGKISVEHHKLYKDKGPVLYGTSYAATSKPEKEVATFF